MHSLIPEQFARFKKVESWQDAQEKSIGYQAPSAYGNVGNFFDAFQKFSNRGVDAFSLNELALIKALGIALRNIDQNRDVKVIDFGGSLGNHYHLAKAVFPNTSFDWKIIETETLISELPGRSFGDLAFYSTLDSLEDDVCDIAIASATLNYVQFPIDVAARLNSMSQFLVLSRLPLWPISEHLCAIQEVKTKSQTQKFSTWFFSEERFREQMSDLGKVIYNFSCPDDHAYFEKHYLGYQGLVVQSTLGA